MLADKFVILDNVQFEKNSYTNRNRIMGPNGPMWITIPVSLKGHTDSTIKDIQIPNSNWRKKVSKSIYQSYIKSPFLKDHWAFFENVFEREWKSLVEINQEILHYLLAAFEIETPIYLQSELETIGKKQDLIISLCEYFSADQFIFGPNGKSYIEKKLFSEKEIIPSFHYYNSQPYPQRGKEFLPNLAAIDLLFNLPKEQLKGALISGGIIEK